MRKTKKQIDTENGITPERIAQLLKYDRTSTERPTCNLHDLMKWVCSNFCGKMKTPVPVINNVIGIDGSFVEFCDENDVAIAPLYVDSMSSWNTENDTESFMLQGVFEISCDGSRFLHAALFHKGNAFEDEISYFVVVDKDDYAGYVAFRNAYAEWQNDRSNSALEVKVFGGEDYIYTRSSKWKDMFLPDEMKKDIKSSVEVFLRSESEYRRNKIPWKRGMLLFGDPGLGKTFLINTIISEYDVNPITFNGNTIDDALLTEGFKFAEQFGPSLIFIEEIDFLIKEGIIDLKHFAETLDGINTMDSGTLVICTANNPEVLPDKIVRRPSRFDRKWVLPYPDLEMSVRYLRKWFRHAIIDDKNLSEISGFAVANNFSYAYLKELYITSMLLAKHAGKKYPDLSTIQQSFKTIIEGMDASDSVSSGRGKFGFDH